MAFLSNFLLFSLTLFCVCLLQPVSSVIHLPLYRRGGRFSCHEFANLTHLSAALHSAEAEYGRSYRVIEGDRLVRKWDVRALRDANDPDVVGVVGGMNRWYTMLEVGEPRQRLEVDVDMLRPDFYTITTASHGGSRYDGSASHSHRLSRDMAHPICARSSEEFHFSPSSLLPVRLDFPTCAPARSSPQSLGPSGTLLGLAPHDTAWLARVSTTAILAQLRAQDAIAEEVWSVTLLDTETGILSLGGTVAQEVEEVKLRGHLELKHFGEVGVTTEWVSEQVKLQLGQAMPPDTPWQRYFWWTDVSGTAGWWTALMTGVWVDGVKILRNQPAIFDINVPFILAPSVAAAPFYHAIGGTKRLPPPFESFFAFPCFKEVHVAFEMGSSSRRLNIPSMNGQGTFEDGILGPVGGRFSLGNLRNGSGYCVGAVVETNMGHTAQGLRSGMRNVWVLGEPFFRELGVVFDVHNGRVGFRVY
ncbi:hypothetical protein AYL99_09791 [Fonsecaea erecta]|uniref:Peptidase A1 domain-containing protein n=1 Tax=Fonsecaea erecta TaxID=1367422 RepID=A0A178Z787_9EURO|nr:hypothetical protein AYL99_09791 [Fonsecaea erecta]OAP55639.1 hypothetical protein AYL99_09791 [Fonsecaea erecta]